MIGLVHIYSYNGVRNRLFYEHSHTWDLKLASHIYHYHVVGRLSNFARSKWDI
jgi:hypothetical protein